MTLVDIAPFPMNNLFVKRLEYPSAVNKAVVKRRISSSPPEIKLRLFISTQPQLAER
jgi:hypothetical protein